MPQRLDESAKGVYVISATPFTDDGAIDYKSAERLVEHYVDEGVHGLTVLGVMGEAPKLSDSEQSEFMRYMLRRVNQRRPVIVGVSNPGLDNLVALSHAAMDAGAAGVMVAGMPGLKTDEQIYNYFTRIAEALGPDVPVCLQDFPPSTSVFLSVDVVNRLIDDLPTLVMFKHEDCPGLSKLTRLREAGKSAHRRVSILTGNGGLYVPQELHRGADGIMTGFAFIGLLVEVYELFAQGKTEEAEDRYDLYLPIIRHEQQIGFGLALRKEVLRRLGVLDSNRARAPGPSLNTTDVAELEHLIERLKKKLSAAGLKIPKRL